MTAPIGITPRTSSAPADITEIVREKYGAAARRVLDINESAPGCGPLLLRRHRVQRISGSDYVKPVRERRDR